MFPINRFVYEKISSFAKEKYKIKIEFSPKKETAYHPEKNLIVLKYTKEQINNINLLCELLHEIGHADLCLYPGGNSYHEHFSNGNVPSGKCKSKKRFIDLIREEVIAWERGWNLVKELKLSFSIPWKNYHSIMQKCLWSYIFMAKSISSFS